MEPHKTAPLLFETAQAMGLQPKWLTDYGLFSIQANNKTHYVLYAASNKNSQLARNLAVDKHATRTILGTVGIPNIPFWQPLKLEEVVSFWREHGKIIAKPLKGSGSRDVLLIQTEEDCTQVPLETSIIEKFIAGQQWRYLVWGGKVIAVHTKHHEGEITVAEDIYRISRPESEWDAQLIELSLKAAKTLGLHVAAVDFIVDSENNPHLLEVNSAPGLWHFQYPAEGPAIDAARIFLEDIIS